MGNWIRARWRAYLESSDPDVALAASTPALTIATVGAVSVTFLGLAYIPGLRDLSDFKNVWAAVGLTAIGGILTSTAWRHRCRGPIGSLATLLDNTLYSMSLAFAAMNTKDSVAIALALVHSIVLALFPGQLYALTFMLALTMCVPLVIMLLVFEPALPVTLITIAGTGAMLVFSGITANRRHFAQQTRALEAALGAADRVADESVQAALTTTLLTLGHFLHELSNYQTAISTNLDFVRLKANLGSEASRALEDAQRAQFEQENLLRNTISDLRRRARPTQSSFQLLPLLESIASETNDVRVVLDTPQFDFELNGNPEHLRVVLLNLIRNAVQAGARLVELVVRAEGTHAIELIAHNDGSPLPEELHEGLFKSFAVSARPDGNGLGLYLTRRYVELLGGRISARTGPLGGAAFVMKLPVRVQAEATSTRHVIPTRAFIEKSA